MNNIQPISLYLLLLLWGLAACRPDPVPTPSPAPEPIQLADYIHAGNPLFFENDSCQEFLMSNCGNLGGCQEFWGDFRTLPGSFNPTNPLEFAYVLLPGLSPYGELYVINLGNGARKLICEATTNRADWNEQGELLFEWRENGVWKLSGLSDEPQQLIAPGDHGAAHYGYPSWGAEGTFFAEQGRVMWHWFDQNGDLIDSTRNYGLCLSASPDDRYWITHQAGAGYCLYDWQRDSLLPAFWPVEPWEFYSIPAWTPDGQEVVFIVRGEGASPYQFIRVNPWTGAQTVIREVRCVNRFYNHPRISPDGEWIYTLMWWIEDLGDAKRYRDFYISFMRIDGSEEFLAEFEG